MTKNGSVFKKIILLWLALCLCMAPPMRSFAWEQLAPRSEASDAELIALWNRYMQALRFRAIGDDSAKKDVDLERQAEQVPASIEGAKKDALVDPLIENTNKRSPDGAYAMSDWDIAEALRKIDARQEFHETDATQKMVDGLGHRYGLTSLRIPNKQRYFEIIQEVTARAMVWARLRTAKETGTDVSPMEIFHALEIPNFREGLDPRIMFDVYLDLLGEKEGRRVLEQHRKKLKRFAVEPSLIPVDAKKMIKKLRSYLHPKGIKDLESMETLKQEFVHWVETPTSDGRMLRPSDLIQHLMSRKKIEDLDHHSGFPLLRILLSLQEITKLKIEKVPAHLHSLVRNIGPLLDAAEEFLKTLRGRQQWQKIYRKSNIALVNELAQRNGFCKSLGQLKKELEEIVLPEDRFLIDPMFEIFPEGEQLDVWNHVVRVAKLGYLLALELGLNAEERQMVLGTCLAHDWGKSDPDISPYLDLERKLTMLEIKLVAKHGARSREIANMLRKLLIPRQALAVEYHNNVGDATSTAEYKGFSPEAQILFQALLYHVYATDVTDALYDYTRAYQRDRPPMEMSEMEELVAMFRRPLERGKIKHGKDPIEPSIVKKINDAFLSIAARATGKKPATEEQRRRDQQFQDVMDESMSYKALHEIVRSEKQNFRLWNAPNHKFQVLDKARDEYFQRLWRAQDLTLEFREDLFTDILNKHEKVAAQHPEFALELYMATVVHLSDPLYSELDSELDKIKEQVHEALHIKGLRSAHDLRRHVAEEIRKAFKGRKGSKRRFVAAMILGPLGGEKGYELLKKASVLADDVDDWKIRRAAVDALGTWYHYYEKRLKFVESEAAMLEKVRIRLEHSQDLQNEIPELRWVMEDMILGMTTQQMKDEMEKALKDIGHVVATDMSHPQRSPRVRQRALWVIRGVKHPETLKIAYLVFEKYEATPGKAEKKEDRSWRVRYLALKIAGLFVGTTDDQGPPDPIALRLTVAALADARGEVRARARQILVARADDAVIRALVSALSEENFDGRAYALDTLSDIQQKLKKEPAIKKAIEDLQGMADGTIEFEAATAQANQLNPYLLLVSNISELRAFHKRQSILKIRGMNAPMKQLIMMLCEPSLAAGVRSKGQKAAQQNREKFREAALRFFGEPFTHWLPIFEQVKRELQGSGDMEDLEDTWQQLEETYRELMASEASHARSELASMHASKKFVQAGGWDREWLLENIAALGLDPRLADSIAQSDTAHAEGKFITALTIAMLEGVSPDRIMLRVMLHERFHQVVQLLAGFDLLPPLDVIRKEFRKDFESTSWENYLNKDVEDFSSESLNAGFLQEYDTDDLLEMVFHHFQMRAEEGERRVSQTDKGMLEGELRYLHRSDYFEVLTHKVKIQSKSPITLAKQLREKIREQHPKMESADVEALLDARMHELLGFRKAYPTLYELLDTHNEVAPDPMKRKLRRLTRLLVLLGGDPKIVLTDVALYREKKSALDALGHKWEGIQKSKAMLTAIPFIAELEDADTALLEKPFIAKMEDTDTSLLEKRGPEGSLWFGAKRKDEIIAAFLRSDNRPEFITSVLTHWKDDSDMNYAVAEAIWDVYKTASETGSLPSFTKDVRDEKAVILSEAKDLDNQSRSFVADAPQDDTIPQKLRLQALTNIAVDKGLDVLRSVEPSAVPYAGLASRYLSDPIFQMFAKNHRWAGKSAIELIMGSAIEKRSRTTTETAVKGHLRGVVVGPVVAFLAQQGFFEMGDTFWVWVLRERMNAIWEDAQTAIQVLEEEGWIARRKEPIGGAEILVFTQKGLAAKKWIRDLDLGVTSLPTSAKMKEYLSGTYAPSGTELSLPDMLGHMLFWGKESVALTPDQIQKVATDEQIRNYLDGFLVIPVLTALSKMGVLDQFDPETHTLKLQDIGQGDAQKISEAFLLLKLMGWMQIQEGVVTITEVGLEGLRYLPRYTAANQYLSMLHGIKDIAHTKRQVSTLKGILEVYTSAIDKPLKPASGIGPRLYEESTLEASA